ncbi:conserved protein of unknown function [Tenacibaculum sp. 190130A14a]|uniref:Lipocalin-like domain-containing protein n=1 Tax=Tenacibaculum polynesiense TaxID=3137857 RepID=A0ABP1EY29_9FLAO
MKLKSLLSFSFILMLLSCTKNEIKLNNAPQLNLVGQWKVTQLKFTETVKSSIRGITSIEKTENIGSNFSLVYTFINSPNELDAHGFFDLEIINEWGKIDYSKDVKGIDGIYPPATWLLENNVITLKVPDFTQEIQVKNFTENKIELQYTYQRKNMNILNSDYTSKTSIYHLTLKRI